MHSEKFSDRLGWYLKSSYIFLSGGMKGLLGYDTSFVRDSLELPAKWHEIRRKEPDYNECIREAEMGSFSSEFMKIRKIADKKIECGSTMTNYWDAIFSTIEKYGYEKRSDYFAYKKNHKKFIKFNEQVPENLKKYPERRFSDYL